MIIELKKIMNIILGIYICNCEIIEHGLLHYKAMKHFFYYMQRRKICPNFSWLFMLWFYFFLYFLLLLVSNCSKSLFLSFGIYIFTIDSIYHSLLVILVTFLYSIFLLSQHIISVFLSLTVQSICATFLNFQSAVGIIVLVNMVNMSNS
jgi:hypothetical protein